MTQKEKLIVKRGVEFAEIVKEANVDPKAIEVAVRLALNGGK